MTRQLSLLLALLALPGAALADTATFVTNDFGGARDGFQQCDNGTGSWVCTSVHFPAFAPRFHDETFLAFDANQDGRMGFVAAGPANVQCEPDDAQPNGWDCQEFLPQGPEDSQIWDLIAQDFDGDGIADLGFSSHISGTGHCIAGTFPMTCAFDGIASGPNFDNIDYADFNNDGNIDVFVAYYLPYVTGYSKLCLGDGVGGFTCRDVTESTRSQQSTVSDVSHLDLNSDGLPDLMLEDNGGGSGSPGEFCLNQPGSPGTFVCAIAPFPTVTYQGSPWGFASNDQKVADLDDDGDDDLVFGSRGDAFACWSDGTGGLSCNLLTGAAQSAIETGSAYEVDVAELNGDALPDVLVTHVDNRSGITQCLNNGDHTFACTNAIPSPQLWSLAVLGTEPAVDGDGNCDVTDVIDGDLDAIADDCDLCPVIDASGFDLDGDGCFDDTDLDGVTDDLDLCPATSAADFDLDLDGCLDDTDGDSVTDDIDLCPAADDTLNADGDDLADCLDLCPAVSSLAADLDGDGCLDDTDGDGLTDDLDACPAVDATGNDADSDGCPDPAGGTVTTFVTNDYGGARDGFQQCENGTGSWVCTSVHFPAFAGRFHDATFLAFDANQDGRVGFIAASPANLQCEPDDAQPNGWDCQEFLPQGPEDNQIWDLIAQDFDGDGIADLGFSSHISGTGHCIGGTFPMSCAFDGIASGPNFDNIDYADFNNDGNIDVFVAYYLPYVTGYSKLCLGDGVGGFTCRDVTESTRSQQSTVSDVSHLDLNGDGLPDLMLEDNGGGSGSPGEFCLNQAASPGTFVCAIAPFPTVTYQGSPWGFASNDQKVVDLDNDGDDDLVFGSRGDAFACWSDGAGALSCTLLSGAAQSAIEQGAAQEVDAADLNGDDLPDVLVTNGENISGVLQCLNNGDHTFACTTAIPAPRLWSLAILTLTPSSAVDGDGVCDPTDVIDGDGDGVADDCDDCPASDATDYDADGDGCLDDTDSDGVTDDLDVCPGSNDAADADTDGVPDGCDLCPTGDDAADADVDGVPDACDLCAAGSDEADADVDGVPDACDVCSLGADGLDVDADTVPDACDVCPGADDLEDPDSDGVLGCLDLCPTVSGAAGDENGDGCLDVPDDDLDGVPNDVDLCAGDDSSGDDDGDGVCDDIDLCLGDDAAGDADLDGYCAEGTDAEDGDCDDAAELAFPGAEEVCDGVDNDCNGVVPNAERDLNGNGLPDCTCEAPPCKRGEFVDDQGSFACAEGGPVRGWPVGLLLLALRLRVGRRTHR